MSAIRVYRFGLLAPVAEAQRVRGQMRAAHDYRNDLVAIERGRRAAMREAEAAIGDTAGLIEAVRLADEACRALATEIKAQRSATRSRSEDAAERAALKAARETLKAARASLGAHRAALRGDAAYRSRSAEVSALATELHKGARAASSAYWGSRIDADQAAEAARKAKLWDGIEPSDPRFQRWDGSGSIGVQMQAQQGKAPFFAARLFGDETLMRIDPVATWCKRNRHGEERRKLPLMHMRIGSHEDRSPIWASWPIVMHRDIPSDAVVKGARVSLRRVGPRDEWSCEVTVEMPQAERVGHGVGTCAVNLGWRVVPCGLRVATWEGEDGERGELVLTEHQIGGLTKGASLRSIRDRNFDGVRESLRIAIGSMATAPRWFVDATATLGQWKSPGRLAGLVRRWASDRFAGDDEAYEVAEKWRHHDHHLWAWETSQTKGALRMRRDVYRNFAAMLARRYDTVVVEDMDLREIARRAPTESEKKDNETSRSNRQLVAVSDLRMSIKNAVLARGGAFGTVPAVDVTRTCSACGHVEAFRAAEYVAHACGACGAVWDQDKRACRNILARWRERSNGAQDHGGARVDETTCDLGEKKESRWAKRRRVQAEKLAAE